MRPERSSKIESDRCWIGCCRILLQQPIQQRSDSIFDDLSGLMHSRLACDPIGLRSMGSGRNRAKTGGHGSAAQGLFERWLVSGMEATTTNGAYRVVGATPWPV